ncbi:MAG: Crp/Fnr family transcriptional regulator [Pseudomonadota bacterium]
MPASSPYAQPDRETARDALTSRGWLAQQPSQFQTLLLETGRILRVETRDTLTLEGDDDLRIFGLVSGSISCLISHRHSIPKLATIIAPGRWFGMGPRLIGGNRTISFVAAEPAVVLWFGASELGRIEAAWPDLNQRIGQLAQINSNYIAQIVSELLIPQAQRRILAVLVRLCEGREGMINLALSQSDLAEMANASRATVNATLKQLERADLLAISYNALKIPCAAKLEQHLDAGEDKD